MEIKNRLKRRHFLKTAVAAGTVAGITIGATKAKKIRYISNPDVNRKENNTAFRFNP